jgi:hypothetical protein
MASAAVLLTITYFVVAIAMALLMFPNGIGPDD